MSELVWEGECGLVTKYGTTIREHVDGLLVVQQNGTWDEDDQVILGPEALEAIKEWLKDTD